MSTLFGKSGVFIANNLMEPMHLKALSSMDGHLAYNNEKRDIELSSLIYLKFMIGLKRQRIHSLSIVTEYIRDVSHKNEPFNVNA